jgi:hypothetical protein
MTVSLHIKEISTNPLLMDGKIQEENHDGK